MKYKVIFDTNPLYSKKSTNSFFGENSKLRDFREISEIIIPEMVIEELISQKRNYLNSERNDFLKNPFHSLMGLDEEKTEKFDIEQYISHLREKEIITYEIIPLTNPTAFEEIKELCLKNSPPFDEKSDRGFKDAYIYLTILDYLKTLNGEVVYFVTSDDRFKEAFDGNRQVRVIESYEEFIQYNDSYFKGIYFIEQLMEVNFIEQLISDTEEPIKTEDIKQIWINSDGNWILKINYNATIIFIEVDFRTKVISECTEDDFSHNISNLISSRAFQHTHTWISALVKYKKFFHYEEIRELIKASIENPQISWISQDEDVNDFFLDLYRKNKKSLDKELDKNFKETFDIS